MSESKDENEYWLTLGIDGEMLDQQEIEHTLGRQCKAIKRKHPNYRQDTPPLVDTVTFRLAEWVGDFQSRAVLAQIAPLLHQWILQFRHYRTKGYLVTLSISAFRDTDLGGIEFPLPFIQAVAEAELLFGISIQARFLWDDDEEESPTS